MNTLGTNIRLLREKKGLTQQQLADLFSLERSTVTSWETGRSSPDLETFQKLADFFEVSLDFLLGRRRSNNRKLLGIEEISADIEEAIESLPMGEREISTPRDIAEERTKACSDIRELWKDNKTVIKTIIAGIKAQQNSKDEQSVMGE